MVSATKSPQTDPSSPAAGDLAGAESSAASSDMVGDVAGGRMVATEGATTAPPITPRPWLRIRRWVGGGLALIAMGIAFEVGRRSGSSASDTPAVGGSPPETSRRFQVAGISMAPSYLPRHWQALCPTCDLRFPIDRESTPKKARCYHCGNRLTDFREGPADVVRMVDIDAPIQVGDVVLIHRHVSGTDQPLPALKRVLAVGGQTIHRRGRDLVSTQADGLPNVWIPVDDDRRRQRSRWTPVVGDDHPIAVYHHQNVHHHDLPSPILDDHPFNASLTRKLFPPAALRLRGRYAGVSEGPVTVAAWIGGQVWVETRTFVPGQSLAWEMPGSAEHRDGASVDDAIPVTQWLGPNTPLVIDGPVADRQIDQAIVYRLRPNDRDSMYPLTLGPDEVFVVGDNVAVSVDSRQYGPIPRSAIAAKGEPAGRSTD